MKLKPTLLLTENNKEMKTKQLGKENGIKPGTLQGLLLRNGLQNKA